jgi:hypothetical protein
MTGHRLVVHAIAVRTTLDETGPLEPHEVALQLTQVRARDSLQLALVEAPTRLGGERDKEPPDRPGGE